MKKEPFSCTRGPLTIRGHVFREKEGVLPAVILSHPFMADEHAGKTYAETLARLGYICFTYDFCGGGPTSKSDGRGEDMTVFTEAEDLNAVMDYVRSRPDVDSAHLTLMGQSQGGAVSAMVAKRRPGDLEKLVLFYPALCIPDDARAGNMIFIKFDPQNVPDLLCRLPMKLGGDYARRVMDVDMFEEIGGFDGPVLIVHGTKDRIVNISYSERAKDCYPNCVYHPIEGADHGFKGKENDEAIDLLTRFMTGTV